MCIWKILRLMTLYQIYVNIWHILVAHLLKNYVRIKKIHTVSFNGQNETHLLDNRINAKCIPCKSLLAEFNVKTFSQPLNWNYYSVLHLKYQNSNVWNVLWDNNWYSKFLKMYPFDTTRDQHLEISIILAYLVTEK